VRKRSVSALAAALTASSEKASLFMAVTGSQRQSFSGGAKRRPENPEPGDRDQWVLGSRFARPRMTREGWSGPSEIALVLLLLQRRGGLLVDKTAAAFGGARRDHLGDDCLERRRIRFDRAGQRVAAEGAEADEHRLGLVGTLQRQAPVVDHD